MITGTIKLYQIAGNNGVPLRKEMGRYYSVKERKRIIAHWCRKYAGLMLNHFIQVAPGADLTRKYLPNKIDT